MTAGLSETAIVDPRTSTDPRSPTAARNPDAPQSRAAVPSIRSARQAPGGVTALDRVALGLSLCLLAAVAWGFWGYSYDDNFITYRYARNLAEHGQLAYNLGEKVLGTSAPGYALLLGGLTWASGGGIDPTVWGSLLAALALAAVCLVLWRLLAALPAARRAGVTLLFALLAGTLQWNIEMLGGEALPVLALVAAGAFLALHERPAAGGLLLALAAILRLDAGLAACCAGAALLLRDRRLPLRFTLAAAAPAGAFLAWLAAAFGTVMPHTMAVKRSELRAGASYTLSEWQWLHRCLPGPGAAWLVLLAAAGLLALAAAESGAIARRTARARLGAGPAAAASALNRAAVATALVVGAWAVLHEAAYHLLGVPFAPWYQLYLLNATVALAAIAIARAAAWAAALLPAPLPAAVRGFLALAVAGLLAAPLAPGRYLAAHFGTPPDPRYTGYTAAGTWLRAHAAGTPTAAAVEIGFFGYASRARILDLVGLVSPRSVAARAAGRLPRLVEQERPEYLLDATLFHQQYLDPAADPALAAAYHPVASFADGRGAGLSIRLLQHNP